MKQSISLIRFAGYAGFTLLLALSSCVGTPPPGNAAASSALPGGSVYAMKDTLPLAPELTRKVLPNGLTYYLRSNGNPGGRVLMYLVVATGSAAEETGELGYAHFVEHMAFNGTAGFPENELVDYLRSIGMEFGAEINAYTTREQTVYTLEMPTDDPALFSTGLQVLKDWATAITFDPIEVEKEKGVILEERRLRLGPDEVARRRELPVMLAGSRHGEREPIGTEEDIKAATPDRLKAFFDRHYRPERMAIIVVGDINVKSAGAAIVREFSFTSKDGVNSPRPLFPVATTGQMSFVSTIDKDFDQSIVFYEKIVPYTPETLVAHYFSMMKQRVASETIKLRLANLTRAGGQSWREAYFDDDYFFGQTRIYAFTLATEDGKELDAFSDLATEVERIRRHGFTQSEFQRTVDAYRKWLSTLDYEDNDLKSSSFADEYDRNFMYSEPVPGIINERVYIKDALDSLTLDELNSIARTILGADEGFVAVRSKVGAWNATLTKEGFESRLEQARAANLAPPAEAVAQGGLFDNLPPPGTIVGETPLENGITELVLSNGARVLLKPTFYDKDTVKFIALSPGGLYNLPVDLHQTATLAPALMSELGYGSLDATRLDELTASLSVSLNWSISDIAEVISGKTTRKDLESLLRLVYLSSAEQGRDVQAFNQIKQRLIAQVGTYKEDPEYIFNTSWYKNLNADNPRISFVDVDSIKAISFETTTALVQTLFADASDFTYIIVGDFSINEIKPLLAQHIGAIPAGKVEATQWKFPLRPRAAGNQKVEYKLAREDRATVNMIWAAEAPWSYERQKTLEYMALALNNRLLDGLREELGGTYVVSCEGELSKDPVSQYQLKVSFNADPARVDELIGAVRSEIQDLLDGKFDARYVEQIRAAAVRSINSRMDTNDFWLNRLAVALLYSYDFNVRERETDSLKSIDARLFQDMAREVFQKDREFIYILLPKQAK